MRDGNKVGVIIPALDEEDAIGMVLRDIPDWVDRVIVVDNGSQDRTAAVARQNGATVVVEAMRGYGAACLRGLRELDDTDIIVFLDGDYSDYPEEMVALVDPIAVEGYDMVIGSRVLGCRQPGALTIQQRFGNWFACHLMTLIWGCSFTDLGPFRAIRRDALDRLAMADPTYGWTIEMQIKAVQLGLRSREVPVRYRPRIGVSKISGTIKGTVLAGIKILGMISRSALRGAPRQRPAAR